MPFWKLLLLPLAVIVPLLAYLAGAVADGPSGPDQPQPIVLRESSDSSDPARGKDDRRGDRPRKDRSDDPAREDDEDDDRGDERGDDSDDDGTDDEVRVVVPEPTQVDDSPEGDDDDDRDDDRDDRDDERDDTGDRDDGDD